MVRKRKFENDFREVSQLFPKLRFAEKKTGWSIYGDMDICDSKGNYWETFNIEIFLPDTYPFCYPKVRERSRILTRDSNWHINEKGYCCLDIEHKLVMYQTRGMNLFDFIKNKVYPFFVNQVYRKKTGHYASGEYNHEFDGVVQFYREELEIHSSALAVEILQKILVNKLPQRNDLCICGEKKYKNCHYRSVEFLRLIPKNRLVRDIEGFNKALSV
jgi:hypothetical protein